MSYFIVVCRCCLRDVVVSVVLGCVSLVLLALCVPAVMAFCVFGAYRCDAGLSPSSSSRSRAVGFQVLKGLGLGLVSTSG